MDKATLDKIIELNDQSKELVKLHGIDFTYRNLNPVLPPQQECLPVESLDGLVDYLEQNKDGIEVGGCSIHIVSHQEVILYGNVDPVTKNRQMYIHATLSNVFSPYSFNHWIGHEDFMIKLYSLFQNDKEGFLKEFTATVRKAKRYEENETEDKIHSSKSSKSKGIDIPGNRDAFIAKLKPFRTFAEVDQPMSPFIFRIRECGQELECALYECDGGSWVNAVRNNIKKYLEAKIKNIPVFA